MTGYTDSTGFPTTGGASQTVHGGSYDAFVTKLSATGASRVYSTFLGSSGSDLGRGVAVDASGAAYVAGSTSSSGFPTTAGAAQTVAGGGTDAFVTKLSATGASRVYSTFLGAAGTDEARGVAVDGSGAAYVTGDTNSSGFPTTAGVAQTAIGGSDDAFVTKLSATGASRVYSTYLGGPARTSASASPWTDPAWPTWPVTRAGRVSRRPSGRRRRSTGAASMRS